MTPGFSNRILRVLAERVSTPIVSRDFEILQHDRFFGSRRLRESI